MVKRGQEALADQLFFNLDPNRKKPAKKGVINPILNNLAKGVEDINNPFLKSLRTITETHQFRVRETFSRANNHYNARIGKLIGQ